MIAAESDRKQKGDDNMAGFGGSASSTGNLADSAVSDAKQVADKATGVYNTGKKAYNDAKVASKAARQIASGDLAGAATTAITNPETTLKILLIVLVFFMIPFFVTMMGFIFVVQLPGSIAESVQGAIGQSVDSATLGWEDFKARLSTGVDDFLTFVTTGQSGDASKAYRDSLAIADDPVFYGYTGMSNVMVAVLNNYFKDAYQEFNATALKAANRELDKMIEQAKADGVAPEHITTSIDPELYESNNYLNWTFYVMAGESCKSRNDPGLRLHVKDMVDAAKNLKKSNLWKVEIDKEYRVSEETRTWQEDQEVVVPTLDKNGKLQYDKKGNLITHTEIQQVQKSETYKVAVAKVKYRYSPKEGAKRYVLDYFGVTNTTVDANDLSDETIFNEQVAAMRQLYNRREAYFEDNAELDYDPDAPGPGMGGGVGGMVISGTLKSLINQFYATHPADTLFDAPSVISGPWSGWKEKVSSHLGEIRKGSAHNGTDIVPPSVMYSIVAPSQGIVIGTQTGFANGDTQTVGNAQRGNFVFVYYGESSIGGVFVLYQHLSPGFSWKTGDTIPAGAVIAQTGWSGLCISKNGTGEHLHLEMYYGTQQVNPEAYMSN